MAWSIVGVGSVVEVAATTHTLTEPAGCASGDLLVACISSRIASTTSVTLPTGGAWTLVGEQKANNVLTTGSALPSAMMAYAVRGASAPNLTFTHPTAPSVAIGRVVAYRGGATASPRDGAAVAATTATGITAVSVTGLTTTVADDLIVAMAAGGQEAAWSSFNATTPSGASGATDTTTAPSATWRERADSVTTTGADTSLGIFDTLKTAAGATGNLTVTASVAAGHSVVAGAFKILPAAVNVSVSVTGQSLATSVGTASSAVQASVDVTGQALTISMGPPPQPISFASGGPLGGAFFGGATTARQYMGSSAYVSETVLAADVVTVVIGEAGAGVSADVTGQSVAVSVGDVSVGAGTSVSVPVDGQVVTASVGEVNIELPVAVIARSYAVGGLLGAGYVIDTGDRDYAVSNAYVSETAIAAPPTGDVTVSVSGQAIAVVVGDVTVQTIQNVTTAVDGQSLAVAVGDVSVIAKINVSAAVTGQFITTSVGTVSVSGKATVSVLGQAVAVSVGDVTVDARQAIVVPAVGQSIAVSLGTVTVSTAAMPGVGVWNGSAWVQKPAKVWSGSAWVQKPVKHWNGSAWV